MSEKIDEQWRWPIRIIGWSLAVVIITFIISPWLHIDILNYKMDNHEGVGLHVVNTGIFPIRDDDGNRFFAGQDTIVHTTEIDDQGRYVYIPKPSLGLIGLLLAAIWCLIPLFIALIVKLPPPKHQSARAMARDKRINKVLFFLALLASILILSLQLSALAATVVEVKNTINTSKSNRYFNCQAMQGSSASPRPFLSYAIRGDSSKTETDLSGNERNGFYPRNLSLPAMTLSAGSGCTRDGYSTTASFYQPEFNSSKACLMSNKDFSNPQNISLEIWFKTPKKPNGTLIGLGYYSNTLLDDRHKDRHIYINSAGKLVFGVYDGGIKVITSPASYSDNNWHHVVATLSTSAGAKMYVDGTLVASDSTMTTGQNFKGY